MYIELQDTSAFSWGFFGLALTILVLLTAWRIAARDRYWRAASALRRSPLVAAVLLLMLSGALLDPELVQESSDRSAILLLDISDSMNPETAEQLFERARSLVRNREVQTIVFSREAEEAAGGQQQTVQDLRAEFGKLDRGRSNLEGAFQRILTGAQPQPYGQADRLSETSQVPVILVSDGQENEGALRPLMPRLRGTSMRVYPLVPTTQEAQVEKFGISSLYAPLVAPAKASVEIKVAIRNTTTEPHAGTLQVFHEEKRLSTQRVVLASGTETVITVKSDPSQEGIRTIRALFTPEGDQFRESERRVFLSGEEREKLLLLSGDSSDSRVIEEVLREQAYQVEAHLAAPNLTQVKDLQRYSAVFLNNVAVSQLPSDSLPLLKRFVEGGGGLLVSGGAQSFGLGRYQNTILDDLLPVRSVPPQAEQRRLNVAVQLVIDKSQSMGKDQRLEFAKEAARSVVQSLKDEDYLGVIGFDVTPFEVLRMSRVGENRDSAVERIGRMYPKDQTWLLPALREGRRRLEATPAGRKHMIIVTDGQLRDAGPVYLEDVRQARLLGITVSTVLIGGEFDFGFLRSLSEAGGGRFYSVSDASQLPRIFVQDVHVRSGERTLQESEHFPVRFGSGRLLSSSLKEFPPLKGFVETRIKPEANYELAVAKGVDTHPLLASWQRGKGRVLAFTSDNNGRWSVDWIRWRSYQRFWTDLVTSVRAQPSEGVRNIPFDLRHSVEGSALDLEVAAFEDLGQAMLSAVATTPQGVQSTVAFEQVAKGRFRASVPGALAGVYRVALRTTEEEHRFAPVAFEVSGEAFGERRGEGFKIPLLEDLAAVTGGQINPEREAIEKLALVRKERTRLIHYLLIAAVILFVLEVLSRELGIRRLRLPRMLARKRSMGSNY